MTNYKMVLIAIATAVLFAGCADYSNQSSASDAVVEKENVLDYEELGIDEYATIDWKHYEDQISSEEQNDFQEYLPILKNEEKFVLFDMDNKEISFNEFLTAIESDESPDIEEIVLCDLDNQNGKELIINVYETGGHYLILTRDNGQFFGNIMSARRFEELQKDGKYIGSGGAGDLYFRRMKIDSNGVEETLLGELHGEEKADGSYGERLVVDGELLNQNPQDWLAENYNNPVDWIK